MKRLGLVIVGLIGSLVILSKLQMAQWTQAVIVVLKQGLISLDEIDL